MNNNKATKGKRSGVDLSPTIVSQRQLNKKLKVQKKSTTPSKRSNMQDEDEDGQYREFSNESDQNYSPDHISSRIENNLPFIYFFRGYRRRQRRIYQKWYIICYKYAISE